MPDWITPEFRLALLLAASFACVGLVALWAATSPRHWLLRFCILLAAVSAPLLIPAYEPLLALAIEACVIVAGVHLWRRRRLPATRFSLRTMLLATIAASVTAAVGAQIATHIRPQPFEGWLTIVLDGIAGGLAVLVGAWKSTARRPLLVWLIAITLLVALGLCAAWLEWTVISFAYVGGWPPSLGALQSVLSFPTISAWAIKLSVAFIWTGITVGVGLSVCFCALLARASGSHPTNSTNPQRTSREAGWCMNRQLARLALFACAIAIAAWPVYVLWQLMHPLPLPEQSPLAANGLDEVLAAGQAINNSSILKEPVNETASTPALKAEIAKYAPAFATLDVGLSKQIRIRDRQRLEENSKSMGLAPFTLRNVAMSHFGLLWDAELARREERFDYAIKRALDCLQLGRATARDGALFETAFGTKIQQNAEMFIYRSLPGFSESQCRQLLRVLVEPGFNKYLLEEAARRDQAWGENSDGWSGHLILLIRESTLRPQIQQLTEREKAYHACTRLLICELAVRLYALEHGGPPQNLYALVPAVLEQIPVDPYDPAGGPLRYQRTENSYLLYSLGENGVDDGGRPSAISPTIAKTASDLRLDMFLPPERPAAANSAAASSTPTEANK